MSRRYVPTIETVRIQTLNASTLRFIRLATVLLGPDLPATIVLGEPELGLHPAGIGLLAEMVHAAADDRHRILLTTQSVALLSQFSLEEVAVLNRVGGNTTISRRIPSHKGGFSACGGNCSPDAPRLLPPVHPLLHRSGVADEFGTTSGGGISSGYDHR